MIELGGSLESSVASPLQIENHPEGKDITDSIPRHVGSIYEEESQKARESSFVGHEIELAKNSRTLAIFLMINTMIGSGVLNQPFVFASSGVVGALLGFSVASVSMWYALVLLTESGITTNTPDYSSLSKVAFGDMGEQVIDIAIIVNGFGAILSYILLIGELLSGMLISWGCESEFCGIYGISTFSVAVFVSPFCLQRHFGHLALISVLSICAISLVMALVIIGGPVTGQQKGTSEGPVEVLHGEGFLESLGSIVFALNCVAANFQAFTSTDEVHRNLSSWKQITGTAITVGTIMCMVMGISGYLSFKDQTDGDILTNFHAPGFDFFKMMVVMHLICYIPVDFVVMRYSVVKIAIGQKAENLATIYHLTLTLFMLGITLGTVLSLLATGMASGEVFSLILNLTGGVAGTISSFVLPAAIYLKVMPTDSQYYTHAKALLAWGLILPVLVLTGTIRSFLRE